MEGSYLRYAHIPVASSWEGYEALHVLIETVEDADLRGRLATAVNGRGAFRRFKDVVLEWLKCEGIELVDAETR